MGTVSPRYFVRMRDQSYKIVALFDSWINLSYTKEVNGLCSYEMSIPSSDPRCDLFELDGLFEIYRSIPGLNIPWYREFVGLHRFVTEKVEPSGNSVFVSRGVGLNDFLARTIINYPEATTRSYKESKAETAMKEYVIENCGKLATLDWNREYDGVLKDFDVEVDEGNGMDWEGDRAFDNLLEVLKDIARVSQIDFNVEFDDSEERFVFRTFVGQYGKDRTTVGLSSSTGLNGAGNAPVTFSLSLGNMSSVNRELDRLSESNVVSVLGEGDGATREVQVRSTSAVNDSPWNRREVSRPKSGFESEMQMYGDEVLEELSAKDIVNFTPLMQPFCLYGVHFFLGDKVTVEFRSKTFHRRLFSVSNTVKDMKENISITFSDLQ